MALLILLINILCHMNVLVWVWLLQKPLCSYYCRGFYYMTMNDKLRYASTVAIYVATGFTKTFLQL